MVHRSSRLLAASFAAFLVVAVGGCASVASTAPGPADRAHPSVPSARPSTTAPAASAQTATTRPDPTQGLATYAPVPPGGSGIEVSAPCDSGTFTETAGPHGQGVEATATLNDPAHTKWFGGISVTPWRNLEGDPNFPNYKVTNGTLTLHKSNLTGPDALRNPSLNYAWPQEVRAGLYAANPNVGCGANVYLNAHFGMVVSGPLQINFDRRTGIISVEVSPLLEAGPRQITAIVTSAHGSQQQSNTETAHKDGHFLGAEFALATQFSGFSGLSNFASVTIKAQKPDGTHAYQVTLTRLP